MAEKKNMENVLRNCVTKRETKKQPHQIHHQSPACTDHVQRSNQFKRRCLAHIGDYYKSFHLKANKKW